ncbi:T9SS type A sorting domain-containing protein [Phaeocystidibacter marisrubri]|uniref:T9SS type A sorting domain-containing protein n=1 Tax=Phaeocystidibacter marisrubri TaxID=1577780 RepID=A0A6L3ZJQ4_9FLAO|nr:T9SS type A sorting domain-containing protein [Phaeocystidibacter marisrubri]KAB2818121.1 T9SS type A sorting domain-containing protein [Phaeocystidibacter marisrubri]
MKRILRVGLLSTFLLSSMYTFAQCGWIASYPYSNSNPTVSATNNAMHSGDKYFYVDNSTKRLANIFGGTWMYGVLDNSSQPVRSGTRFLKHPTSSDLYYVGTDNKIYKTYWTASGWTTSVFNSSAPLVRSNSQIAYSSSDNKIYYIGSDGKMYILSMGGSYQLLNLNLFQHYNGVFLAFDDVTDLVVDNQERIWFSYDGGSISYLYYSLAPGYFTGWTLIRWPHDNDPSNNLPGVPDFAPDAVNSPIVVADNSDVYYRRSDGRIVYFNAGSPGDRDRPWSIVGSYAAQGHVMSMTYGDGKMVFVASNNQVRNIYYSGGTWNDFLVNPRVVTSPSPVWINDGEILYTDVVSSGTRLMNFEYDISGCKKEEVAGTAFNDDVTFFPNPAGDHVTIENTTDQSIQMTLVSAMGQVMENMEILPSETHRLDVSNHPSGVYLVRWTAGGTTHSERLIIQ